MEEDIHEARIGIRGKENASDIGMGKANVYGRSHV